MNKLPSFPMLTTFSAPIQLNVSIPFNYREYVNSIFSQITLNLNCLHLVLSICWSSREIQVKEWTAGNGGKWCNPNKRNWKFSRNNVRLSAGESIRCCSLRRYAHTPIPFTRCTYTQSAYVSQGVSAARKQPVYSKRSVS